MKDFIKKLGFVTCILLMMNACDKDFLEKNPKGTVNENNLVNEDGIKALLIATYAVLDGYVSGENPSGNQGEASGINWVWGDVPSDDIHRGDHPGGWTQINDIERYEVRPDNEWLTGAWGVNYEGVSRANDVLKALENAGETLPTEKAKQIEAEAKFLRAWYHFQLRIKFEKIPYITENVDPLTVSNDREVWDEIEADLQYSITNLNPAPDELGRASKWAAKAFMARVHLFQNEFTEAKPLLDDIINNGPFQLESHFYNNFDEEHQNNGESIFEIQYSVNDGAGVDNSGIDHQTLYPRGPDVGLCCAYSAPTFDLFNAFKVNEEGLPMLDNFRDNLLLEDYGILDTENFTPTDHYLDPRVDWTIGRRGIPFLDWGPMSGSDWMQDQLNMGPFLNKKIMFYKENLGEISTQSSYWASGVNGNNFRVLRLGHVLMWRAEVAVEENDLATALSLVNQIRQRAADDVVMGKVTNTKFGSDDQIEVDPTKPAANYKLSLYPSFPSQEYARKAVRFEMRLEFALEGMRFYDLVRWGTAESTLNTYLSKELENGRLPWLNGAVFNAEQDDHWPIPQVQIDLQNGVLTQDPAY
ncbi:Starch-binding associating with outer membrane [Salegentibacter agarivorans]|uniref:Starch-binding associating with outer membrane n=1 Tax=Salegentibacter agarivorans TaxID=345907 RepID=A0A1I2KTC7_9FLAO|nr:RagB/SusD family nutrient uptake outer membrane protein [Salegentibacter agarivorans]SFF68341.1 Starch-binding associating with outer membrane [Salegentibacter agarivorans]